MHSQLSLSLSLAPFLLIVHTRTIIVDKIEANLNLSVKIYKCGQSEHATTSPIKSCYLSCYAKINEDQDNKC